MRISIRNLSSIYKLGNKEFSGQLWYTKRFLEETLIHPGCHYGAFIGNKLIGSVLSKKFDRPKIWLMCLVVDKPFRNQGIATKLIDTIRYEIVSSDTEDFFIMFVDTDLKTAPFYEKIGFDYQATIKHWYDYNKSGMIYSKIIKWEGDFIIS